MKTYKLKAQLAEWDSSMDFWRGISRCVEELRQEGCEISANLYKDRIEVAGDFDALEEIDGFINRRTNGLMSNREAYLSS